MVLMVVVQKLDEVVLFIGRRLEEEAAVEGSGKRDAARGTRLHTGKKVQCNAVARDDTRDAGISIRGRIETSKRTCCSKESTYSTMQATFSLTHDFDAHRWLTHGPQRHVKSGGLVDWVENAHTYVLGEGDDRMRRRSLASNKRNMKLV